MVFNQHLITALTVFLGLNSLIALLFWLYERLEHQAAGRLRTAVETAVRAVEQVCAALDNQDKKQQAALRVEAYLGWYRWVIPALVIDTAIEAEVYVIKYLHRKLNVKHDAAEEITGAEGSQ